MELTAYAAAAYEDTPPGAATALVTECGNDEYLLLVADGNAAARPGPFACEVVRRTARRVATERTYRQFYEAREGQGSDPSGVLHGLLTRLCAEVKAVRPALNLSNDELRLCLTLAVWDDASGAAALAVIGGGHFSYGETIVDVPVTPGTVYFDTLLDEGGDEHWWTTTRQRYVVEEAWTLALATPALHAIRPVTPDPFRPVGGEEIKAFLLTDAAPEDFDEQHYALRLAYLRREFGLGATEALGLARGRR